MVNFFSDGFTICLPKASGFLISKQVRLPSQLLQSWGTAIYHIEPIDTRFGSRNLHYGQLDSSRSHPPHR